MRIMFKYELMSFLIVKKGGKVPLKPKYQKIKEAMIKKYGKEKGEQIFWAWVQKNDLKDEVDKKEFYTFYSNFEVKSLEGDIIEGYISTYDVDLLKDRVSPRAMFNMLQQLLNRNIKLDLEHETFKGDNLIEKETAKTKIPVGKIIEANIDEKGLWVRAILNPYHPDYEMIKNNIKSGFIDAFSIAYVPTKTKKEGDTRILEDINLLNVALTGNPVNPEATFTKVMVKSLSDLIEDDKEINKILKEVEEMVEENKPTENEKKEETAKQEETETKEQTKETEKTETTETNQEELKAYQEKINSLEKQITELKNVISNLPKQEEADKKITELKAKIAEIEKQLDKPQFKSKIDVPADKAELTNQKEEIKSVINFIK